MRQNFRFASQKGVFHDSAYSAPAHGLRARPAANIGNRSRTPAPPLGSLEGAGAGRMERSSRLACAVNEICAPLILYQVSVNIDNGVITSPNVQTFRGNVTSAGAVRASVAVQEKNTALVRASCRGSGAEGPGAAILGTNDARDPGQRSGLVVIPRLRA